MSAQGPGAPPPRLILAGVEGPRQAPPHQVFPALIDGYFPARGSHVLTGAQNTGKTALTVTMLADLHRTGHFLGHRGHVPPWVRLLVFDRGHDDWKYWCDAADIECPRGYWLRDDLAVGEGKIRSWQKDEGARLQFFREKVEAMDPEPGGLLITDGGVALIGDATSKYFISLANVIALQRFTCDKLGLTHLLLCHAGKPKKPTSNDAKARDMDKANLNAGALGGLDTLSYLASCAEVLDEHGRPVPYQRFTWTPHHGREEEIPLGRTESGLFTRYLPPEESFSEDPTPRLTKSERKVDPEKIKQLIALVEEAPERTIKRSVVIELLKERYEYSPASAYRIVAGALKDGFMREEEGFLKILAES